MYRALGYCYTCRRNAADLRHRTRLLHCVCVSSHSITSTWIRYLEILLSHSITSTWIRYLEILLILRIEGAMRANSTAVVVTCSGGVAIIGYICRANHYTASELSLLLRLLPYLWSAHRLFILHVLRSCGALCTPPPISFFSLHPLFPPLSLLYSFLLHIVPYTLSPPQCCLPVTAHFHLPMLSSLVLTNCHFPRAF